MKNAPLPVLALLAACGADSVTTERPPDVVLICLDTVRADHLGCYGYERRDTTPWMDALAARSTVFEECSATAGWTKPSVPSFLTGTYPLQHGVYRGDARDATGVFSDVLPDEARTLAEVFGEVGYQTAAFVKNAQLRDGMGFEQGFDLYVDQAGDAREIRWQASDWLEDRDPERPFFLYLHFLDAHWPYPVPEEYATLFANEEVVGSIRSEDWRELRDEVNSGERELTAEEREALIGLYDGALRYLDDQLARLERRLPPDTVICIVSDHGEEFGEHGKIGHGHGLWENLLDVPWILHAPGRRPARVETPVSLVDLYPTLIAAAGLDVDAGSEGVDRLRAPDLERPILAEHLGPDRYHQSWRWDGVKTIAVLEPERGAPSGPSPEEILVSGGRWEARVTQGDGPPLARRLKPSDLDEQDREPELKGILESLGSDRFVLNGLTVRLDEDTELYGELLAADGSERRLTEGMLVKARGPIEEGVMRADKVKLYGDDRKIEMELRGELVVGEEPGRVLVAGVPVLVDDETDIDIEDEDDLTREDVLGLLLGEREVIEQVVRNYDLHRDPGEESPAEVDPAVDQDEQLGWLRELIARRRWGETRTLNEHELEDLRAIGYAE